MKTIVIVEVNKISVFPPVQTLIKIILNKGYYIKFIGRNINDLPEDILNSGKTQFYEVEKHRYSESLFGKTMNKISITFAARKYFLECVPDADYVWTTSMNTMKVLRGMALNKRNILQLMELAEHGYYFRNFLKFPIKKLAQKSWKTVVPEVNRAYIQKTWWELERKPYVLPNKPFNLEYGELTSDVKAAIDKMKQEKRKIVFYLGGIWPDRSFEECAKAICESKEYVFYLAGDYHTPEGKKRLDHLINEYKAVYLGAFHPPKHLALVQYAQIGLLSYKPVKDGELSELNALYCAPNKIFEYAGFGVPMVGSDVLGLKLPFEQWNIGLCCDFDDGNSVIRAIEEVDKNHDEMSRNCYRFYNSVDMEKIVSEILEDED